jgi:hypothetical protein
LGIGDKVGITKNGTIYCTALKVKTDYKESGSSDFGVCFRSQQSRITFMGHFNNRYSDDITSSDSVYWSVKHGTKRCYMADTGLVNESSNWSLSYGTLGGDLKHVSVKDLYNLVQYAKHEDRKWIS